MLEDCSCIARSGGRRGRRTDVLHYDVGLGWDLFGFGFVVWYVDV